MSSVTTYTIMSVHLPDGTASITSRVVEPVESALAHLRAMGDLYPGVEPVHVASGRGWRWTWESISAGGNRCVDTVRIY